jgi:NTP pyrophosphatase (non-canonical NTP hydrolase)
MNNPTIVVSGSLRKNYEGICNIIKDFEDLGINVLSPKPSQIINPGEEFPILETDNVFDPKELENRHLDAIRKADALYLYNPGGYVGPSCTMELGWALALGKYIYCKEPINDFTLKLFSGIIATPEKVKYDLSNRSLLETLNPQSSTEALQRYIKWMVMDRGFENETPRDLMLLLTEEIGELAKAIRKHQGLKMDQSQQERHTTVRKELADVYIYLLDIANSFDVSLCSALIEKERENENRTWG